MLAVRSWRSRTVDRGERRPLLNQPVDRLLGRCSVRYLPKGPATYERTVEPIVSPANIHARPWPRLGNRAARQGCRPRGNPFGKRGRAFRQFVAISRFVQMTELKRITELTRIALGTIDRDLTEISKSQQPPFANPRSP